MLERGVHIALLALLFNAIGCAPDALDEDAEDGDEPAEDELTAEAADALISDNAMTPNAMTPNAMTPNAMTPNALTPNALVPATMTALQAPTADGALARTFMKYLVSCALDSSKSFSFSWTTSNGTVENESYPGLLGLAPEWASGPLTDDTRKRLVSGCMAARVNYYGTSVIISARSVVEPLKTLTGCDELANYKYIEGAFWGNLFTSTPYLNACYQTANVAHSRQAMRDCAAGHLSNGQTLPCGMIQLRGPCSSVCQGLNGAGQYYPSCIDRPGVANSPTTKAVITTALP